MASELKRDRADQDEIRILIEKHCRIGVDDVIHEIVLRGRVGGVQDERAASVRAGRSERTGGTTDRITPENRIEVLLNRAGGIMEDSLPCQVERKICFERGGGSLLEERPGGNEIRIDLEHHGRTLRGLVSGKLSSALRTRIACASDEVQVKSNTARSRIHRVVAGAHGFFQQNGSRIIVLRSSAADGACATGCEHTCKREGSIRGCSPPSRENVVCSCQGRR